MLFYGLHPALIEPVVWISAQFDLLVTFFTLASVLLNRTLRSLWIRALAVAFCFFLAACAKESAITIPLLLLLFDWMGVDAGHPRDWTGQLRALFQRQWPVYASILTAGACYLALRYWALGMLVHPITREPMLSLERWQTISFTYLTYWRILAWPM